MKKYFINCLLSISCLSLLFSISSCKPEEQTKPSSPALAVTAIPQTVKDYTWFDVGTTWTYQDSATGNLDSMYVFEAYYDTATKGYVNETPLGIYEQLTVKYISWVNNYEYYHELKGGLWTPDKHRYVVDYVKYRPSWGASSGKMFFYPLIIDGKFSSVSGGDFRLVDTLNTISIKGNLYNDVLVFYNQRDGSMNYERTVTWVAKHYGIIRKESVNSKNTFWLIKAEIRQ